MHKQLTPYIISVVFIVLTISSNSIAKWQQLSMYKNYSTIDEPLRKVLEQDEFLADESSNRIYVINLWATWCKPCAKEIPHLNKLVDKYEDDGVLFLAINSEEEKEVVEWLDLQKNDFIYFHLHNQKMLVNYLFELNPDKAFKAGQKPQYLPSNIIIKDNKVVYFKSGYDEESILELEHVLKDCL